MEKEEKELLLKDLCARLPHGVKISWRNEDIEHGVFELTSITSKKYKSYRENGKELAVNGEYIEWRLNKQGKTFYTLCEYIKPYLRPMSSMTKEERGELRKFCETQPQILEDIGVVGKVNSIAVIDWLNAHHFDYRGLIPMGLALEAPEGMYKIK